MKDDRNLNGDVHIKETADFVLPGRQCVCIDGDSLLQFPGPCENVSRGASAAWIAVTRVVFIRKMSITVKH